MLMTGALGALAAPAMAEERSPLFIDVPPTRTAPAEPARPLAAAATAVEPAAPATAPVAAAAPAPSGPLAVEGVRVEPSAAGRTVRVDLSREPKSQKHFTLTDPPRIVVDVAGPVASTPAAEQRFPVEDSIVSRVRAAPFQGKLRVVFDLREEATLASVTPQGRQLTAELQAPEKVAKAAAPAPAAPAAPVVAATEPPAEAGTAASEPEAPVTPQARNVPERVVLPAETTLARTDRATAGRHPKRDARSAAQRVFLAEAPAPAEPVARPRVLATAAPAAKSPVPGQRISLDFKDADIQNVLRVLADVSGKNLIATDDVKGKVTLHLHEVPWQQAFDLILRTNRLEATEEGNVVRISSVKRLTEEREAMRDAMDAQTEAEPLRVKYVRVNYARADAELIDKVRGVLTERGSVTFDDRTNTVIVRDINRGIDDATDLVRRLDVQSPQVLIESNIVEATEGFDRGLGVQWGYSYKAGPETGNPTGMNFPGTVGLGGSGLGAGVPPPGTGTGVPSLPVPFLADFPVPSGFGGGFGPGAGSALDLALGSLDGAHTLNARLTALENEGKGRVISRPRVITMNNVAATIQSLTILRVKLPSTGTVINTGEGGTAGGGTTATEKINTGITLVVTPQVSSDGYVLMNIYAKSSQPDFSRAVDGIPNEISREANSNVLVRSGETVVLGGIYRQVVDNRESGIPYLRTIPVLGWLFKRQLRTDQKEELLVFLTPKVIETGTAELPPAERLWNERPRG
jgi:type IV pilus secretin PilQ/predicted competence protein